MIIEIATILSIIGAGSVALGKSDAANSIWAVSNPLLFFYNIGINEKTQALLFLVFTGLAWMGCLRTILLGGGELARKR